ncbi:HNH endonuclease [Mycobacterium phage Bazzle]
MHKRGSPRTSGGCHDRVRETWGKADQYACAECGDQAKDWAYDGTDPGGLYLKPAGKPYSVMCSQWPEFYMPLCRSCHRVRDARLLQDELTEYRKFKQRTGLTLKEVEEMIKEKISA